MVEIIKAHLLFGLFFFFDRLIKKDKKTWAFSVHHIKGEQFIENQRALFHHVRKDETIRKIIFTRDRNVASFDIDDDSVNYEIVYLLSWRAMKILSMCGVIFVSHSIAMDYSIRFARGGFTFVRPTMTKRRVINVWHGIPIKALYALANDHVRNNMDRVRFRRYERKKYSGFITSSVVDSYAMTTMFYPIRYSQMWVTGLPRYDFLKKKISKLPEYIKNQVYFIESMKLTLGKKIVLYAPTYRNSKFISGVDYYSFSDEEVVRLKEILKHNNAILAFRIHYFKNEGLTNSYRRLVDNEYFFDFGHEIFSDVTAPIRCADVIITDYSSVMFDAIYMNKDYINFCFDMDSYIHIQDGLIYDPALLLSPTCASNFDELVTSLNYILSGETSLVKQTHIEYLKHMFFKYTDENNSERIVNKIEAQQ